MILMKKINMTTQKQPLKNGRMNSTRPASITVAGRAIRMQMMMAAAATMTCVLVVVIFSSCCHGFTAPAVATTNRKYQFSISEELQTTARRRMRLFSTPSLSSETINVKGRSSSFKEKEEEEETTIESAMLVAGTREAAKSLGNNWQFLVPAPWENPRGWDCTVEWESGNDEIEKAVAERLLPPMDIPKKKKALVQQLTRWMKIFERFTRAKRCKARIVSSRGKVGGKCPQFHVDHVPVRWIQSLVGPGPEFISDNDSADWTRISNLMSTDDHDEYDKLSVEQRNRLLVPNDMEKKKVQVPEGQAVMLLGNGWKEWCERTRTDAQQRYSDLPPVIHKSPEVPPWQGRVLLTMDILS